MNYILSILIILVFSSSTFSQSKKTFISKDKKLEVGIGVGLFAHDNNSNFYRIQLTSRDLILERFGLYFTFEYFHDKDYYIDLLGLTYRLNDNFSLQAASGFTNRSLFTTKGFRKEMAITFHPKDKSFAFTTGYSISLGPTITVNYKLFGKNKNKRKNTEIIKANKSSKTSESVHKNAIKDKVPTSQNVDSLKQVETNKPLVKATFNSAAPKVVETLKPKVLVEPKINYDKLCDDNKLINQYNSDKLSDSEKAKLVNFVKLLKSNTEYKLIITGRTDKIGSDKFNLDLGQRRADNAKKFLVSKGVNSKQIISLSVGESQSQNANTMLERKSARSTVFKIITQ